MEYSTKVHHVFQVSQLGHCSAIIHDRYLLIYFMGLNTVFRNCQGIRSKRKELELYLKENATDIIALNETFLSKKHNFKIPGYDTIRNDRSTGLRGGVAFS